MEKHFNTAGPNQAARHYTVDPLSRWNLSEVLALIEQDRYFVLHAPRQTGKTSCLLALVEYLNAEGHCHAIYSNVEPAQAARENVERGMKAIVGGVAADIAFRLQAPEWHTIGADILERNSPEIALNQLLSHWAEQSAKPVVLFLDEVDSLVGDTLISLLRQIRAGYPNRPNRFPSAMVLCGVRDVRDYRIHSAVGREVITGGSAFNIKTESLRLGNFTLENIRDLYGQHTAATGQVFEEEVFDLAWRYTAGQPWLVNALAREATYTNQTLRNRSLPVTMEVFKAAKESLILRRDTHLDQLADKLREDRVKRVIQPMLAGAVVEEALPPDDIQYVIDLGLVSKLPDGTLGISNEIYREVIPRELTWSTQMTLTPNPSGWYLRPDGGLDMEKLLGNFQSFFREHSEHWLGRFDYQEAGPQLLLQAFLQRVVNGGGTINREYGLGRLRTDLYIEYGQGAASQRIALELKLLRGSLGKTLEQGLLQATAYMDRCAATEGHLVIFDRSPNKTWAEKIWSRTETYAGKTIQVWGC